MFNNSKYKVHKGEAMFPRSKRCFFWVRVENNGPEFAISKAPNFEVGEVFYIEDINLDSVISGQWDQIKGREFMVTRIVRGNDPWILWVDYASQDW